MQDRAKEGLTTLMNCSGKKISGTFCTSKILTLKTYWVTKIQGQDEQELFRLKLNQASGMTRVQGCNICQDETRFGSCCTGICSGGRNRLPHLVQLASL